MKTKPSKKFLQLLELIDVVSRHRIKKIEVLGNPSKNDADEESKLVQQFYWQLSGGKFKNDDDAAAYFQMDPKDPGYRRLRTQLLDKLIDMMFFMDTDSFTQNASLKNAIQIYKRESAYKIIRILGLKHNRVELSLDILEKAILYEFIDIAISVCRRIINDFSYLYEVENRTFDYYCKLVDELLELQKAEILAATLQKRFMLPAIQHQTPEVQLVEDAQKAVLLLDEYAEKKMTYIFHLHRFSVKLTAAQLQFRWEDCIGIHEEALQFLSTYLIQNDSGLTVFAVSRCNALFMLGRYEAALLSLADIENTVLPHSQTWYNVQKIKICIFMQTCKFTEAFDLMQKVMSNKRFTTLEKNHAEIWHLYRIYLNLFALCGQVKLEAESQLQLSNWSMDHAFEAFSFLNKDKKGFNITILIARMLYCHIRKVEDDMDHRIEALLKYRARNINDDRYIRTIIFIDMLHLLVKHRFDIDWVKTKLTELYHKLLENPYNKTKQPDEIELVPYDLLWLHILNPERQ
ncbi:MAG: hypothetical protein ACOYOA_11025 [Saprospiraceae bacterium]